MATDDKNPLLFDFVFPPYDVIRPEHIRPAIRSLLRTLVSWKSILLLLCIWLFSWNKMFLLTSLIDHLLQERDAVELEKTIEPTWPKLVEPLERITDRLRVIWKIVNHLSTVKDSPELRSAIQDVQPEKVGFELRLGQSKAIYNAFKAIRESADWEDLNDSRKRIVEAQLKKAVINGVSLEDNKREQFNCIEQELERITQRFEDNVSDAIKKYEKLITNKGDIEGLPATVLALAAQTAVSKGHEEATAETGPWVLKLNFPCYRPVMQHVRNRSLREELYRAYISRASSGELNNTPLIEQILRLRMDKAKLLGYNNYAELSMEMKMATVEKAEELIESLCSACWDAAVEDVKELESFAKSQGASEADNLCQWDIMFWSERIRELKHHLNEEELRPFFSLPRVIDGLFSLAKMLFEIDIVPADGQAPVWDKDVKFYCVKDVLGKSIAYFYFDPYSRPSEKQGGAWVDDVVVRSRVCSQDGASIRLPITVVVCNQTPPVDDKPSLMTFREVEAVFHEFGHALQKMLTKQDEGFVSGNRGIEWDAIELPSTFMEKWCYQRKTLMSIARHYETGDNLPEEICSKLISARTFRAGSEMLRQLRFASVDLELHKCFAPGGPESIYDIDQRVGKKTHVIPLLLEDRFICSFTHIFHDEYDAGYYSYQWAEVLSADAFSAFEESGLENDEALQEIGRRFRKTVLELGGGKHPLEVFVEFRGREPSPQPLLRYLGVQPAVVVAA